jgi:hypothetical protein
MGVGETVKKEEIYPPEDEYAVMRGGITATVTKE